MAIQLKLQHEEGIRLRQQTAQVVERKGGIDKEGGIPVRGTEWKFDKFPDPEGANTGRTFDEVQQDRDQRRIGADGKHIPLGTYTVHVTANMRNLVVERKGKVTPYNFKNPAIRNQMRVQYQTLEKTGRKTKDQKDIHEWKNSGQPQFIAPNTFGGVFVGDNQRAVLDEMPT